LPYKDRLNKIEANRAYRARRKVEVKNPILVDIGKKFSDKELRAISNGTGVGRASPLKVNIDFHGNEVRFGFITDTHMGSIYYREEFLEDFIQYCLNEKADFVIHGGDVTNGLDQKKYNLLYESTHIGYSAQKKYAIEQLAKIPFKKYIISGNHDSWWMAMGAHMVEDICNDLSDCIFLGEGEGDISLGGITIRVWHGDDGSSYATSYRLQRLIESFTGGEKPNVLLAGHVHKQGYFYERMVHAVSGGALCTQSKWMRGKRLANHSGFHFVKMIVNEKGVASFSVTWRPFYE
jgi:predicted phosphodiesterase